MSSIVSFKVQQTFYLFCFTQEIAIEIFQSILQCKMILALDISDYHNSSTLGALQAKVKNVANPLSISNYLVNLATQAQGQEHAGFEKLIYLILCTTSGSIYLILFGNMLLFDIIQRAASYIWSYSATYYYLILYKEWDHLS